MHQIYDIYMYQNIYKTIIDSNSNNNNIKIMQYL